jgi:hypothetical protein
VGALRRGVEGGEAKEGEEGGIYEVKRVSVLSLETREGEERRREEAMDR